MDESIVKYFERPTELRPAGEVQQKVGRIKLSEAIRIGADHIPESRHYWGCAIGAACFATGLKVTIRNFCQVGAAAMYKHLADKTTAPLDVIFAASEKHFSGESRQVIIDWLAAQGL